MNIREKWAALSLLTGFFDEPETLVRIISSVPAFKEYFGPDLPRFSNGSLPEDFLLAYDDLFKGTNADIYIPLWASCCLSDTGCLLDHTTLEVIRTYHRYGYIHKGMDGNPPDYIGEQFRFLCYLIACCENSKDEASKNIFRKAADEFTARFTLVTARRVAAGISFHSDSPFFKKIAGLMQALFPADGRPAPDTVFDTAPGLSFSEDLLECSEILKSGPNPPAADEPPRIIRTSGRNNCGGKCAVKVTVCEGCILDLSADCGPDGLELKPCLRGLSYHRTYMDGRRLRYPMIRRGKRGEGLFRRVSLKEAVDYTENMLRKLTSKYGPGCRYVNYGFGVTSLMGPNGLASRFLNLTGGALGYYGSYSSINSEAATAYTYGSYFSGNSPEDLLNTNYLILWAHNPVSTVFGIRTRSVLSILKAKGTKIIVIDPRCSESVKALADEWIPILPSTDGALADAMAYTIWSEGLEDQHFMDTYCVGFDAEHMPEGVPKELNYHDYLYGIIDGTVKTPEWAEKITGVPAETIRKIAVEYASAKPACLLPGLGNQRTGNGEQTARGLIALTCLTGNVGIPGGGAAGCGAALEEPMPFFPAGTNPYKGVISCFLWTQAVEEGHKMTRDKDHILGMDKLDADIKFIFNLAGNTLINQHSDINRTKELLKDESKCECIAASDVFMTPSMRFADLVLPAPSFLEEDDINMPWRYGHYLLAENAAVKPVFCSVSEYDFFEELSKRFGVFSQWSDFCPDRASHMKYLYEHFAAMHPALGLPPFDRFMDRGHAYKGSEPFIAFADQIRNPDIYRFSTPSGKIEIVSGSLYAMQDPDIPAHPGYLPCREGPADPLREKYPLQLIGFHTIRRCHTVHDNNALLEKADPQLLWIHPQDAAARGIIDGDTVRIFNERGGIRIRCSVTDHIMPGVTALAEGAWYTPSRETPDGNECSSFPDDLRGSINVLTGFYPTPLAKGNPQHTNLVEVVKC